MNPKASCVVSYPALQDNSTSKLQFMNFVSEVWVSLPSAARDCPTYQSRRATHAALEFHNERRSVFCLTLTGFNVTERKTKWTKK